MISQLSTKAASFLLFVQVQNEDGGTRGFCAKNSFKAVSKKKKKKPVTACPHVTICPHLLYNLTKQKNIQSNRKQTAKCKRCFCNYLSNVFVFT